MKKILSYSIAFIFLLIPFAPSMASGDFVYRSTVLGTNVVNTYGYVYEINNQKDHFRSGEDVFVLTRIFNIRDLHSFQFKQVAYSPDNNTYKTLYSPVYRPGGQWWAETYSWVNFGKLANGNYNLKTYISVDNGYFRELSEKDFTVSYSYNSYNYRQNHNNWHQNFNPNYSYNWTRSDNNLRHNSGYIYSLDNPKTSFLSNENVVVLTKLTNIRNIDRFQIKHEFFKDGRNRYKTLTSPERRPGGDYWQYNYNYNNFGTMPVGNHTVKVFIKINGGSWRQIDTLSLSVKQFGNYYNYNHYNSNYNYNYDWTRTGDQVSATTDPASYYAYNNRY